MSEWDPIEAGLKHYPHFDEYLSPMKIEAIVKNPDVVRSNPFFPFLRYNKHWRPFRKTSKRSKPKDRPIRYASRRDAYIFSYYRHVLSEKYEDLLKTQGLATCVIGYRKIPVGVGAGGKCNIHFAKDAFDTVIQLQSCCAVALDISSYFESIDHDILRKIWCRVLGVDELPADHAHVFRNITRYAVVDRDKVYERLGYIAVRPDGTYGYTVPYNEMPTQLCSPKEFREKICGGDPKLPSLIEVNKNEFGIPQGAPLSDLLANMYLVDFDKKMHDYAVGCGGEYMRYSDDILLVVPGDEKTGRQARDMAIREIKNHGPQLDIKQKKSMLVKFQPTVSGLDFTVIDSETNKNGLEYLGFRFDGRQVYLRDSTLSGLYRKISFAVRHAARAHVARYPGKDLKFLQQSFDVDQFVSRYGRVEDFDATQSYREWTFWSYARRASQEFGSLGKPISRQLRKQRDQVAHRVSEEIKRAYFR